MIRGNRSFFFFTLLLAFSLFCTHTASGQEAGERSEGSPTQEPSVMVERSGTANNILVADTIFCTGIINKECVEKENMFSIDNGRIYCHTTVHGAKSYVEIKHIWYHGGSPDQIVRLPVKSSKWRTWSVKTLFPEAGGDWRVEVFTGGLKIGEGKFTIVAGEQKEEE